jgi:tetratricopeptide (TPR) repeat protein
MVEDLDQVLALKASAKSSRDDDDWEGAISDLKEAIQLLNDRAKESSAIPSWLASELADAYGLMGGIEKRWGLQMDSVDRRRHLKESAAAYDIGFAYEQNLEPNDANTYNRVNRIVGRVLLDAHVLRKGGGAIPDIAEDLENAEDILTKQIESEGRQKDPWAYCDLGTVRLLRGKPDALAAFGKLDQLRPPSFVYESALTTLLPLREVASDLRPDLIEAVTQLQRSARYSE